MEIDITQSLKDSENLLREFISTILEKKFGSEWPVKSGVTPERLEKWQQRKDEELKRQQGGVVEPRLIYYADFYDIQTILEKHWNECSEALGELKTMRVYLDQLGKLRDPDAHRRELLPHQKQLAAGIAGEIRTRLIRYRSKLETTEDYFPRIECARDSLGNSWIPDSGFGHLCSTDLILRPDDVIDYVVTASDPMGQELQFLFENYMHNEKSQWQKENTFSLKILENDVGRNFCLRIKIKSPRAHHALQQHDDHVDFYYTVLPKK